MNAPRMFSLGAILSVTEGSLVAPNGIGDVYEIVNYLTGDSISTIGLLAAHEPCKAALLAQHPQLVDAVGCTQETWRGWAAKQVEKFGAELPVVPMQQWEPRAVADDILDINRMNPTAGIMVLES